MVNIPVKQINLRRTRHAWRPEPLLPGPGTLAECVARVMAPGAWYARPDLALLLLPGARRKSVDFVVVRMRQRGLVEQGDNADWHEHVYRKGIAVRYQAAREPRYLFRLTPLGETLRRQSLMLA